VRDLVRGDPPTASVEESASVAWDRMHELDVDYLVVQQAGRVVGMLSRYDLRGPSGGTHRRMGRRVGDLMQRDFAVTTPGMAVRRLVARMRRQRIECVPVMERNRLVGIVTVWDLLALLERDETA
jgi:CBS domain-containing protein